MSLPYLSQVTLVGKLFLKVRLQRRLSQSAVAKRAGIPAAQLSQIESGVKLDPRFSTVIKIAAVLDLSLDELARQMQDNNAATSPDNTDGCLDSVEELRTIAQRLLTIADHIGT